MLVVGLYTTVALKIVVKTLMYEVLFVKLHSQTLTAIFGFI